MTAPSLLDELEEVVPGELDATAPAVIWLQLDTDGDNERRDESWAGRDGVTWCDESIGGLEIQYVRADLYRDMAKRLEAAERDARRWRHVRSTAFREFELDHVWLRFAAIEQFDGPIHPLTEAWIDESVDRRIAAAQEGEG